jgi:DNA-binding NtrC family response regulator
MQRSEKIVPLAPFLPKYNAPLHVKAFLPGPARFNGERTMDQTMAKASILIAEDERGPREVLEMILRPFFILHSAENADRVLQLLEREEIDIVTLDLHMPGFQGMDLIHAIKEKKPDVELIIITGDSGSRAQMAMNMFNIAGYILKPFDIEELLTVVNGTLNRKRQSDVLKRQNLIESETA